MKMMGLGSSKKDFETLTARREIVAIFFCRKHYCHSTCANKEVIHGFAKGDRVLKARIMSEEE